MLKRLTQSILRNISRIHFPASLDHMQTQIETRTCRLCVSIFIEVKIYVSYQHKKLYNMMLYSSFIKTGPFQRDFAGEFMSCMALIQVTHIYSIYIHAHTIVHARILSLYIIHNIADSDTSYSYTSRL